MTKIKTVGIREFKDHMSAYLREVRGGLRLFISDRNEVVAEIHTPNANASVIQSDLHPILEQWVEQKKIILGRKGKVRCEKTGLNLEDGTAIALIEEDRG